MVIVKIANKKKIIARIFQIEAVMRQSSLQMRGKGALGVLNRSFANAVETFKAVLWILKTDILGQTCALRCCRIIFDFFLVWSLRRKY